MSFSKTTTLILLLCSYGIATPFTGNRLIRSLYPRQDSNAVSPGPDNPFEGIETVVVDAGQIDDAGVLEILSNLPTLGEVINTIPGKARKRQANTLTIDEDSFVQPLPSFTPTSGPVARSEAFTVNGPFRSIQVASGGGNIRGLVLTDVEGKETTFGSMAQADPSFPVHDVFEFEEGERISELTMFGSTTDVAGFTFKTTSNREYKALPANDVSDSANVVKVGSGMIGRARGLVTTTEGVNGITFVSGLSLDFVDEFEKFVIAKIAYDDFNDGLFPSGPGITLSVGAQTLDNRNSSIAQKMSFKRQSAVTKTRSLAFTVSGQAGGSVAVAGEAGLPFIGKSSVTATVNWGITTSNQETDTEATTTLEEATFDLTCPANKFCEAQATMVQYKLDVGFTATFVATTKKGATFNWIKRGQYKGADSTDASQVIKEFSSPPNAPGA